MNETSTREKELPMRTTQISTRCQRTMPRSSGGYGSALVRQTTAAELIRAGVLLPGRIISNYGGRRVEATLLADGHVLLPGFDHSVSLSGAATLRGAGNVSGYEFWQGMTGDGEHYLALETIRRHYLNGKPRRGTGLGLVARELAPDLVAELRAGRRSGSSDRELATRHGLRQFDVRRALGV
jgi:hypothetical protein